MKKKKTSFKIHCVQRLYDVKKIIVNTLQYCYINYSTFRKYYVKSFFYQYENTLFNGMLSPLGLNEKIYQRKEKTRVRSEKTFRT